MTRGPLVQVVLHQDEADAPHDLTMFARALARKSFLAWPFQVVELDTTTSSETAVVTLQFSKTPRKIKDV